MQGMKKPKAVIVGGSIAGLSCAHSLQHAGWEVVVLEKSSEHPNKSPTGAGLGLDPTARRFIQSCLDQPELLDQFTLPLSIDQNEATDPDMKISWILTRDENFGFRAAHWSDLHGLLHGSLPPEIIKWGYLFHSFSVSDNKSEVTVKARVLHTGNTVQIRANLLIAADGCLSSIRQSFIPGYKLRYSGYCAWRGVLDFSGKEDSELIIGIKKAYPDLGNCLYFDIGPGTHSVLYELLNKRLNWIWYINQPEPETKGNSVTMKVSQEMIKEMHSEAEKVWRPELVRLMKETSDPFINVIYDADPLEKIFWDNVVLVGDAAHPTTPHGLRSTNMSILDAAVLGICLERSGLENLRLGLEEYQKVRAQATSKQVLYSRRLGQIKQGLSLSDRESCDTRKLGLEELEELKQRNIPFFNNVPLPESSA